MGNIKNAKNGKRYLLYADLKHHQSVDIKSALRIAERAIIDFALSQQHALLNKQGILRQVHVIESEFPPGHKRSLRLPNITHRDVR
jgi:hypothetical protein